MTRKITPAPKSGTTKTTRAKKTVSPKESTINLKQDLLSQIKIDLKHKNETQKKLTQSIKNGDVTVCIGPAGTGKTYISCQQALLEIKNNDVIKKIVLVKSVTTLKTEEIGFLKGSMEEKMEPFMYSFIGNFEKIIGKQLYENLKTEKYIEILPIAYLRGVNIDNAIVIIDEVQNISIDNIRTILTRLGENSKMVFLGDIRQIDSKNKNNSALKFLVEHFNNVDSINIIEINKNDIVRHPLIKTIEDIFDKVNENENKNKAVKKPKESFLTIFFRKVFSRIVQ
jgi:phosphate starvation-inducible protein PhoH and related proteins